MSAVAGRKVSGWGLVRAQFLQVTRQPGQLLGLAGAAALLVLIAILAAVAFAQGLDSGTLPVSDSDIRQIPGFGFVFAQLLLGSTLITLVTTEWTSGSILGTAATTQHRTGILAAKSLVSVTASLAALLLGGLASVAAANAILSPSGRGLDLTSRLELQHLLGLVAAGWLSTLLAVGMAFLLRRTAVAIVVYIALVIVAPIALGLIPWDPMMRAAAYLPLNAAGYMMATAPPAESGLSVVEAYLVMIAWAMVGSISGWWRMTHTDI